MASQITNSKGVFLDDVRTGEEARKAKWSYLEDYPLA